MPLRVPAFAPRRARGDPERRRRGGVRRSALIASLAVCGSAVLLLVALPSPPRPAIGADAALERRTIGGAFHVHTTRSDGAADKASVARAASRAGLEFVVFTDHGDGTRTPDPPEYVDGVLCLDGVELSTDGGHYIALEAQPSPYPLGGESAAVVEDVARLGGFGVAAHPVSPRRELAWSDWSLPVDGIEWLNADSEWRDESRWQLARSLAAYPLRPTAALAALLDRPVSAMAGWDRVAGARRVLGIAGHDAHGGVGGRMEDPARRRRVGVPSYAASLRSFSTRVEMDRALTGEPAADGRALLEALRAGKFHTAIDAIATGSTLEFTARGAASVVSQGSVLRGAGPVSFIARAAVPDGATIISFRNGAEVARGRGGALQFESGEMGAYRVEVHVAGAPGTPPVPWLVSNPIFRLPPVATPAPQARAFVLPLPKTGWRIEKDDGSRGAVRVDAASGEVELEYRLRAGARVSQFVALVTDLPRDLPAFHAVTFVARSTAPRRVSVQLRFAGDADARWGKSVYVDPTPKTVTVPIDALRRADGPPDRPDARRATSLLFVIDLTNAKPGDQGSLRFGQP